MPRAIRVLTVSHSYVVTANRRLAHAIARAGRGRWEVTAVAPSHFHGTRDLRPASLATDADEPCPTIRVPAYLTRQVHAFVYGSRLRRVLRSGWDLVHCWEEPFIVAGGQVAAWTPARTPLVYATFQNLPKRYPPPFNWVERYCLRRAAGWVAFGRTVADNLAHRPGYRDRPWRVIPPGVDVERFRPDPAAGRSVRRELGWDDGGPPVVGFLGRFLPEKGVERLTEVLDGLRCPWRALFVGAGPLEGRLRSWADRHGGRARVCTDVRHDAVPRYLNALDLLAAPSQTTPRWREQFGRMTIEAFACGVPVVGSDSGEIPHVLGRAGIVVGEADVPGWRRVLTELLGDPGRRRDLAAAGLERAHTLFSWPVVAAQHLDFFRTVLKLDA
jgi:glycosyltransferase involved in cell wall biosynthesis